MAGKQDKISNTCPESCSLYSHSIAKVLLYVFVRVGSHIGADEQPRISKLTPFIYEPGHEISNNVVCATNKVSDQPAHTGSLIRAFASPLKIL